MQIETLKSIEIAVELLKQAGQDWWLIGGAAFLAHGVGSGALKDIDVLIGSADARQMEYGPEMQLLERAGSNLFRSAHYFSCHTGSVPIEFMADLKVRKNDKWHLLAPKTRVRKMISNCEVYVPDVAELIEIAQLFGREKDLARIVQLDARMLK
ncbi:MAG: hypothetical protein L3J13_08065 [Devosiaceae bacterium]|nr:hypothetical protein [Devosiaceae bacterium]